MKTLYIARHAKSNWEQPGYTDFDRPLNEQGIIDAKLMSKKLSAAEIKVDVIISSSAVRACTTANIYASTVLLSGEPIEMESIYEADEREVLKIINNISDNCGVAMLVGHNPAISLSISALTSKSIDMSAGNIVQLEFNVESWKDVKNASAQLVQILFPKNI